MEPISNVKAFVIKYEEYLKQPSLENHVDLKYKYFQKADIDEDFNIGNLLRQLEFIKHNFILYHKTLL